MAVYMTFHRIHWAWAFIGLAAVFDFLDGFTARMLNAYSPMGKELDSLSDLVSFGLAPAFMVMSVMAADGGQTSCVPFAALFIALMGALRLAKFNVDTRQATSFIGLPIPANAIFWIGATAWIESCGYPGDWCLLALIIAVSLLMVSELPMFSLKFKSLGFAANWQRYVILAAAVVLVAVMGIKGLACTIILYVLMSAALCIYRH